MQQSLANRAKQGLVTSGAAASGLDITSGSPASIIGTQKETGLLDVSQTLRNSALTADGYRAEETGLDAQAGLYGAEAESAPFGAALSTTGSLLSQASNLPMKYSWMQNQNGSGGAGAFPANPLDVSDPYDLGVT